MLAPSDLLANLSYMHGAIHKQVEGLLTNKATSRTRNVIGSGAGSGSGGSGGGGGGEGMQEELSFERGPSRMMKRVSMGLG